MLAQKEKQARSRLLQREEHLQKKRDELKKYINVIVYRLVDVHFSQNWRMNISYPCSACTSLIFICVKIMNWLLIFDV